VYHAKNYAYLVNKILLNANHASKDSILVALMDNAEIVISMKTKLDASNVLRQEMVEQPANGVQVATDSIRKQIIVTHVESRIVLIVEKEQKPVNHVQVVICLIKEIRTVLSVELIYITVRNALEIATTHNHVYSATRTLPCQTKLRI